MQVPDYKPTMCDKCREYPAGYVADERPLCRDCYKDYLTDCYTTMPLEKFLREIDDIFDENPDITIKDDMVVVHYRGAKNDIARAARLLELRGAIYAVNERRDLLTFVVTPVNGGKLDVR